MVFVREPETCIGLRGGAAVGCKIVATGKRLPFPANSPLASDCHSANAAARLGAVRLVADALAAEGITSPRR